MEKRSNIIRVSQYEFRKYRREQKLNDIGNIKILRFPLLEPRNIQKLISNSLAEIDQLGIEYNVKLKEPYPNLDKNFRRELIKVLAKLINRIFFFTRPEAKVRINDPVIKVCLRKLYFKDKDLNDYILAKWVTKSLITQLEYIFVYLREYDRQLEM